MSARKLTARKATAVWTATVLALLASLAGCGGEDTDTAAREPVASCEAEGVDQSAGKVGTCTRDGVTYTVVDRGQTLELDDLDARLKGVETRRTLRIAGEKPARAKGRYVVLTLSVKNKLDEPARFGGPGFGQTLLGDGRRQYTEEGSGLYREGSFARKEAIEPGEVQTGELILETSADFAENLDERKVNLAIANFEDAGAVQETKRLGVIRLWK